MRDLEYLRQMVREGDTQAALLYLIDEVEWLWRKPVEDDFRTAATSKEVCTCSYKPYPHPKYPAHPDRPREVETTDNTG